MKSQLGDNHNILFFFFPNIDLVLHLYILKKKKKDKKKENMTKNQISFYCLHLRFTERAISRFCVRSIYLSLCFIGYGCSWIKKRKKERSDKDGYKNRKKERNLWSVRVVQIQLWAIFHVFIKCEHAPLPHEKQIMKTKLDRTDFGSVFRWDSWWSLSDAFHIMRKRNCAT